MNSGRRAVWGIWLGLSLWFGAAGPGLSSEVVQEISWGDNATEGAMVLPPEGTFPHARLVLENLGQQPFTSTILTLQRPAITTRRYALAGQIRYQGVTQPGYLEMLNRIPGQGEFFTRTLADSGPLRGIEGESDWRSFVLPFDLGETATAPDRIVVNLVLKGTGKVEIGPLVLRQFQPGEDPLQQEGAWWSGQSAGLLGGIGGVLMGLLGATIGYLSTKGRGRRFVLAALQGVMLAGAVCLVGGVLAWFQGQPYAVFYPLLLFGILGLALPAFTLKAVRRHYTEMEMRRMRSEDAGPG